MDEREPLDWTGSGYDAFASPNAARDGDDWALVDAVISSARRGIFHGVHELPGLIARTHDLALHSVACEIVADAGDAADLETLVQAIESADFERGLSIARALAMRGRLVDVPAVFFFYELNQERKDAQIARLWLNWLLCEGDKVFPVPGGDTSWEEYRAHVGRRYFELWSDLETNLVHVHRGQVFDLGRMVDQMIAHLQRGVLHPYDRRIFEVTTGNSCRRWYADGRENLLRVAADLERFAASGQAARYPRGQRAFMGHVLEDVMRASVILDEYPDNDGMGVPFARTSFDVDEDFSLEYGFEWQGEGYFYTSPKLPPTARVPSTSYSPWLSLHTCLREAREGNREPLASLMPLILRRGQDDMFITAAVELLADAADDVLLEPWRHAIAAPRDLDRAFDLGYGLLRRGMLRDVPLVLELYRQYPKQTHYSYFQAQLNALFVYAPVNFEVDENLAVDTYCDETERRYEELRDELGGDDVPIFRGVIASVCDVAREIVDLVHGPSLTYDLRARFESSTGIDCSDWCPKESTKFDYNRAATVARQFLKDGGVNKFEPGHLYFFGYPIKTSRRRAPRL